MIEMSKLTMPDASGQAVEYEIVDAVARAGGSITKDSDKVGVDLDVSDGYGNVIMRLADGEIETMRFDSRSCRRPVETFREEVEFVAGSTNTISVDGPFYAGELVCFHLVDDQHGYDFGRYASYYEEYSLIVADRRGSNGYFLHRMAEDCEFVRVAIGGSQYSDGQALALEVYRINRVPAPKVITVAADGSGMFTTLKAAVESITDASSVVRPYVIEIYPGTYDTLEGFTDEEIASADIGGGYSQTSFVGLKLTDGISLRGMGSREDVVLTASLSTSTWSSDVRGNISTLNLQGSGALENLTIVGENLRYAVHDDFNSPINTRERRVLRNLAVRGVNTAYTPYCTAYGAGMTVPRDYVIEDCDFDHGVGIHSGEGHPVGCEILFRGCTGHRAYFTDYASAAGDAVHRVRFEDCVFDTVELLHAGSGVGQHMLLEGGGCDGAIVKCAATDVYCLGRVTRHPGTLAVGTVVQRGSGDAVAAASALGAAFGVVVGAAGGMLYVQRAGYVASDRVGLSGLALGDTVGIDASTGKLSASGTGVAGTVRAVDSGVAYIYLQI